MYKFGKNNQSLQILYTNISQQQWGNAGGLPGGQFPSNPNSLVYYPYDSLGNQLWMELVRLSGLSQKQYSSYNGLSPTRLESTHADHGLQQLVNLQTRFLKFEYDNSLSANTYVALRYYNWDQLTTNDTSQREHGRSVEHLSLAVRRRSDCRHEFNLYPTGRVEIDHQLQREVRRFAPDSGRL